MKLLEAKQVVNSMFASEWTETVIQWYGLPFSNKNIDEWIMVSVIGLNSATRTLDNNNTDLVIDVAIYAKKENRTLELYDMLSEMFLGKRIKDVFCSTIRIDNKLDVQTQYGDYKLLDTSIYLNSL